MSGQASNRLRIVSDGTSGNTVIYDAAGDPLKMGSAVIEKIEILPIVPNTVVRAVLTLAFVGLDVDADTMVQTC